MRVEEDRDVMLGGSKWLDLIRRYYIDNKNRIQTWEFVRRAGNRKAVVIIAQTKRTGSYIILKQFRVPLNELVYEFPAGLVDKGEKLEETALRELEEETGYRGRVTYVTRALSSSAGLTSEMIHFAYVECDEEPKSKINREASEEIEVIKVHPANIYNFLHFNSEGIMDAKLFSVLSRPNGRVA